jgi:hypothetical protein
VVGDRGQASEAELVGDLLKRRSYAGAPRLSLDEIDDLPLPSGQFGHIPYMATVLCP